MTPPPGAGRDLPTEPRSAVRHGAGFIASGIIATAVDAGVLAVATRYAGLDPLTARLLAVVTAMIAAFFAHRRLTFAVTTPPNLSELARFLAVAWSASAVNYGLYALLLVLRPATEPLVALAAATGVSMAVSYLGLRFGVFVRR